MAAERGGDPLAAGSLAVGAGHAAHPQRFGRTAIELVREDAGALLQVPDRDVGQLPLSRPIEALFFPDHRARTVLERLADVRAAVGFLAGIGEECDPRRAAPAVGGEPLD